MVIALAIPVRISTIEMDEFRQKLGHILEAALITDIEKSGQRMAFSEGDEIIGYDKYIKGMPLVLDGSIRVMGQDEDGREILLYYISSTESCTMAYSCCMELRKSEIRAIADTDVYLTMIPCEKLDAWLLQYPTWKTYVFQSFNHRFNEMLRSIESIAFKKLDEGLVEYLEL